MTRAQKNFCTKSKASTPHLKNKRKFASRVFSLFASCAALVLLLTLPACSPAPATTDLAITAITDNSQSYPDSTVPRYEKLEITFQLGNSAASNYQMPHLSAQDAGDYLDRMVGIGISVDALFLPPGETNWTKAFRQPAFYFQDFESAEKGGKPWIYPKSEFSWKVRFAPNQVGTWRYQIHAVDRSGSVASGERMFTVGPSSNKGFIRVAKNDPRYFEYDNADLSNATFTGLGHNTYDVLRLNRPNGQEDVLKAMQDNNINFIRTWLQPANIYSSAWSAWTMMPPVMDNYLPRVPVQPYYSTESDPGSYKWFLQFGHRWYAPCAMLGQTQEQAAIKSNTNYHIKVRYRGIDITGPFDSSRPNYGFIVQISPGWLGDACASGNWAESSSIPITRVTPYGGSTGGFVELNGVWNSGDNDFLPNFYLALENVKPGSKAFIDLVEMKEMTGGTVEAPTLIGENIIEKYSPEEHLYMAQKASFEVDQVMEKLEQHDIYIRLVVSEKDEYLFKKLDPYGTLLPEDDNSRFYGMGREETASRWLQKAWWRYIQARWGYSTNIHSWELINEGDPDNPNHYALADEFGKFMHCEVFGVPVPDVNRDGNGSGDRCLDIFDPPNDHLVSTSTWHSYPVNAFWGNKAYPNVDYADFHLYNPNYPDTARDAIGLSLSRGALAEEGPGKPLVRGESSYSNGGDVEKSEIYRDQDGDGQPDSQGIWLHHLLWAQLNTGGMYDPSEWWSDRFIYEYACITENHPDGRTRCARDPVTQETRTYLRFDYRPMFRHYSQFVSTIPLNNGQYKDLEAQVSSSDLRIVGQKDVAENVAHMWIRNFHHTWKNVADKRAITPVSGSITLGGFSPEQDFQVEWWNTYTGQVERTTKVTSDQQGQIVLTVKDLQSDIAVKIAPSALP